MQNYVRESNALRIVITTEQELPKLQPIYSIHHNSIIDQVAKDGNRRMLLQNARIVDAHYGYAELESHTTHLYVIPTNVREVRDKVMELLRDPVLVDVREINHPIAKQVERELLDKIKTIGLDAQIITKALDTIKKYHAGVKKKSGEPFFAHSI